MQCHGLAAIFFKGNNFSRIVFPAIVGVLTLREKNLLSNERVFFS